jgi:geranylgeranylglycerol-phosphate geranylgeranyltransferase
MVKRLLVSIEISRPHNMLVAALGVAAGYTISGGSRVAAVWPTALLTALVTGAGNVINDFYDVHIDRVNKPRRPLPSGRMSIRAAAALYSVATALITVVAFALLPGRIAFLIAAWQLSLYLYARWVKKRFIVGNLLVAAVTSSVFLAGAILAGNATAAAVPVAIAAAFVLSRELVKGAEDVDGDRASGVSTVAVVAGTERAVLAASVLMLGLVSAIPSPALAGHYGTLYLWAMETTVVPGLLAAAYMILSRPNKRSFSRASWLLKVEMFFGVLAIGVGRM